MQKLSILFGLSGSEQSRYAAEVAWTISRKADAKLSAVHVIDTRTVWEMLRNEKPGFIGASMYVEIYDKVVESMRTIANKLVEKFEAVSRGEGVPVEAKILEGNPVKLICGEAAEHDLVIIGHQPRDPAKQESEHCHFVRYAVAEGLSHECSRALLVVQDRVEPWKSMSILLSVDHVNLSFIRACLKFAAMLELKPKIIALATGTREEGKEAFIRDLKEAYPELADVETDVQELSGIAVEEKAHLWQSQEISLDWQPDIDTLLVIPTRKSGKERITVFDTSPDRFVRYLPLPSMLLWPEEHTELGAEETESRGKETVRTGR